MPETKYDRFVDWFADVCEQESVQPTLLAVWYHREGGEVGEKQIAERWMKRRNAPKAADEPILVRALAALLPDRDIRSEFLALVETRLQPQPTAERRKVQLKSIPGGKNRRRNGRSRRADGGGNLQ